MIIDADVIVKFKLSKLVSKEDLDSIYAVNLEDCVRHLVIEEGHIISLADDDYDIIYVGMQT